MFLRALDVSLIHRRTLFNIIRPHVLNLADRRCGLQCFSASSSSVGHSTRDRVVVEDGRLRGVHYRKVFGCDDSAPSSSGGLFTPHPFNRRFAFSKRPLFPIEPRNLRIYVSLIHHHGINLDTRVDVVISTLAFYARFTIRLSSHIFPGVEAPQEAWPREEEFGKRLPL